MTDELSRKFHDYNAPVYTTVHTEGGETRLSVQQDGDWVSFSSDVLDQIVKARDDYREKTNAEPRLTVARGTA